LYQTLLGQALTTPSLLKAINRFYCHLLFSKPKHFIDTPVNVLNFDCLFP
jgi:L-gulonolactone oxidase